MRGNEAIRGRFSAIKERLLKAGIPWAVFAGAAAYCYGSKREITDIDIFVRCEDLQKAESALNGIDYEGFDVACGFEIETNQGTCCFFLDDEMIERIKWKKLFGVTVPVISVEDNIIFKGILQRGEDEGKYDIEDIRCMIKNEKVDLEYLENRIQKCQSEKRIKLLLKSLFSGVS